MSQPTKPYCYTLYLSGAEDQRIIEYKKCEGEISNFKAPVTAKSTPKIYILKSEGQILYIGHTTQSVGTRFGYGFRANGKNGYHGYKWRKTLDVVELLVFVFEPLQGDQDARKAQVAFAEAIEAELVYLVRQHTGRWPEYQNEIHFNNTRLEEAKVKAGEIYENIHDV